MDRIIEQHITNEPVRSESENIPSIDAFITCRVLCYIGKAYIMTNDSLTQKKILSAWIHEPRKIGTPQKSCWNSFVDPLNKVFHSTACQTELMIREPSRLGPVLLKTKECGTS